VPSPTPSPPSRRRTTSILALVAAAVVVLLVVAGLFVAGVGPFAKNNGPGSLLTFKQAESVASQSAANTGGGSWSAFFGGGVDLPKTEAAPANFSSAFATFGSLIPNCTAKTLVANGTVFVFPAFTGNVSGGVAPVWIFLMIGSSSLVVVLVINGSATNLIKFTGIGCAVFSLLGGVSGSAVDSSVAVQAALKDGGYSALASHPGGSFSFDATPGISLGTRSAAGGWQVSYTTCPITGGLPGTSYYSFAATVGLLNGTVVGTPTSSNSTTCTGIGGTGGLGGSGGPPPLSTAIAFGPVSEAASGSEFYYNASVESASSGMSWPELLFQVKGPSGSIVTAGPTQIVVSEISGCQLTSFSFVQDTWSSTGATCAGGSAGFPPIVAGDTLSLESSENLNSAGDVLAALAVSGYTGSVDLSLP
jgi:hypothetical protein